MNSTLIIRIMFLLKLIHPHNLALNRVWTKKDQVLGNYKEIAAAIVLNDNPKNPNLPSPHELFDANYHSDNIKRFFIAALVILICLLILMINRYLAKRRMNNILKFQYRETALNNQNLYKERCSLLAEKGNLLAQKEWLLAEIHHRVRNNLHTIVSLMESQAVYLKNDALSAMEKSQHRIYAMSLIHQNMYSDELLNNVDIISFVKQLSRYLNGCYSSLRQIVFQFDIDPVKVSITQAIPLALLINEVLTNAILHAFKATVAAKISVSMHQWDDLIKLIITDNGIGINLGEHHKPSNTLGMTLIKGLTEDINGKVMVENNHGTRVTLIFPVESPWEVAEFGS